MPHKTSKIRTVFRQGIAGLKLFGIDTEGLLKSMRGSPTFVRDLLYYYRQHSGSGREFRFGKLYPCLTDRDDNAGSAQGDYFHQDLLVSQWIFERKPDKHVDIGSRVDGFVAHVATFMPIEVFDIRPLSTTAQNIHFRQCDIMGDIGALTEYTSSLSCLHALEHFGLGRYGDRVDYYGHVKGWENIYSMLVPGGTFYFSSPVGPSCVEFNAHRVFSTRYLMNIINGRYLVERFAYVDSHGELFRDVEPLSQKVLDGRGCGVFMLRKQ
ncbi:MAG: DUF268 domain-containing protein [Deltaproteobacteria bacterium]|nr:DUF268 domain-containing protein [Deltaproteobacteria bacterium]